MLRQDLQNFYPMNKDQSANPPSEIKPLNRVVVFYLAMLFGAGALSLYITLSNYGALNGDYGWGSAFFFLILALFTITMVTQGPVLDTYPLIELRKFPAFLCSGPSTPPGSMGWLHSSIPGIEFGKASLCGM
ncbi:MAG: hypothetical protein HOI35_10380 [Woeseia sp.]|jgi:hypothetical protein|nr:hypothetical protein [Woeseia sp.]MBT6210415.1 hypothetical protein [Woeseia sp.]